MIEFEGVVLAQYPSSEHSAMVVVLSKEGKKSFFARGVLKTNHPFGSVCSLGSISHFQCRIGPQNALTLSSGTLSKSPLNRFKVAEDLFIYQLLIELLSRIDMEQEEKWYEWFLEVNEQFNHRAGLLILGDALYEALQRLGIGINLSACAKCGTMESIQDFSIHEGGLLCTHCVTLNKRHESLPWIKTMIQHFHYHRFGIDIPTMKHWISLAIQHLHHELNLDLVTWSMIQKIH